MTKRSKDSMKYGIGFIVFALLVLSINQIVIASEDKDAFSYDFSPDNRVMRHPKSTILNRVSKLHNEKRYNYENTEFEDEFQIVCNDLHCSDGSFTNKSRTTICPELQNASFVEKVPFDGLGNPQCNVYMEQSLYIPDDINLKAKDVPTCEMSPKNFPNETTLECIKMLSRDASIKKVVWIVHGYHSSDTAEWLHDMKNNIQKYDTRHGKTAVILIGWGDFEIHLFDLERNYVESAQNTRYVGYGLAIIANEIKRAVKRKIYFHCIGHSLGAHICGFGGKYIKELSHNKIKFDRISGLDPAGPIFCEPMKDGRSYGPPADSQYCIDSNSRLDSHDADIVDVVHTDGHRADGDNYGTMKLLGSIDYYAGHAPSFGWNQPGCEMVDDLFHTCSHVRSHKYFSKSIKNDTLFPLTSKCQNGYPKPSNCEGIESKHYSEDKIKHHPMQALPEMGYWHDKETKGIYTIDVMRYCDLVRCNSTWIA